MLLLLSLHAQAQVHDDRPLTRIAFGSCFDQMLSPDIWTTVVNAKPDVFVMLGDNVYADATKDLAIKRVAYDQLAAIPAFETLRSSATLLATWDDHDYGVNDAGGEYPDKALSQQILLDFLREKPDAPRRARQGVYEAYTFGPEAQRVQIILLDTRYHRSALTRDSGVYQPNRDPQATVLGEAQWTWLESQLQQPAQVRVIASSIQVIPEEHRFEKWANFPLQRERLLQLLSQTKSRHVVLISGDRHFAEISRLDLPASKGSLYEVTSSSMNRPGTIAAEPNRHRVGSLANIANFGLIELTHPRDAADPNITLRILDAKGQPALAHLVGPVAAE